jgi:hypothetical protein
VDRHRLSRLDPFFVSLFSYAAVGLDSSAVFDTIYKAVAVALTMHVMVVPACDVGMVPAYCLCVCVCGGGGALPWFTAAVFTGKRQDRLQFLNLS